MLYLGAYLLTFKDTCIVLLIDLFLLCACVSTEALSRLNFMIREPNALHPDNVMAYDNAVSALGKICQFHRDSIDASQVHSLHCLPCLSNDW